MGLNRGNNFTRFLDDANERVEEIQNEWNVFLRRICGEKYGQRDLIAISILICAMVKNGWDREDALLFYSTNGIINALYEGVVKDGLESVQERIE